MLTWNLKVPHSGFGFPLLHLYSKYVGAPRAGKYLLHQFRVEKAPRKHHQVPPASPEWQLKVIVSLTLMNSSAVAAHRVENQEQSFMRPSEDCQYETSVVLWKDNGDLQQLPSMWNWAICAACWVSGYLLANRGWLRLALGVVRNSKRNTKPGAMRIASL